MARLRAHTNIELTCHPHLASFGGNGGRWVLCAVRNVYLDAPMCCLTEFGDNSDNNSSDSSSDEEDATQLDILLALSPDVCMLVPETNNYL